MCATVLHGVNEMSKNTSRGGVGFLGMLTLLFVGLKLTNYINWSWWWVISPALIPFGLAAILLLLSGVCGLLGSYLTRK